jgi:hypothetical protein
MEGGSTAEAPPLNSTGIDSFASQSPPSLSSSLTLLASRSEPLSAPTSA